ncbi:MAG: MBL fold metallo-hydrolase [Clostridia bacterium]|nr:MBL fold metallo-hydrolase [Clostridia bacterium]
MNLIEFFGLKIKPRITKGKGMWNPLNNQICDGVICMRDKDVNCFLIKDTDGYIAIDSGYKNSRNIRAALTQFGISANEIKSVFLTHLDIDHAGGMDIRSQPVYPVEKIYLGAEEGKYLTGEYYRKKVLAHKCKLPIKLNSFTLLNDGESVSIGNYDIQAIYSIGHTLGHTTYIVNNKWLFSGDCIIANENGGYCFYDFWNTDTKLNMLSLKKLEKLCSDLNIKKVFTAHSGVLSPKEAFRHKQETPNWREKNFVFCQSADINPYE